MDGLSNNLLANGLLAGFYVVYKILDRCMHSKCRYTKTDGFAFDIDPVEGECPATDMERIADLLKSRALVHQGTSRA
jgi:hypothetical protein